MRFAIVGAGALGAYLGASLTRGGSEAVLIGSPEKLRTMRLGGVHVTSAAGDFSASPACADDCADVSPVDVVILALEAHELPAMLGPIRHLMREDTLLVMMHDGNPEWNRLGPAGTVARTFEAERVVGCAVPGLTEMMAPNVVRYVERNGLRLGLPNGGSSYRLERLCAEFVAGGMTARIVSDIRAAILTDAA